MERPGSKIADSSRNTLLTGAAVGLGGNLINYKHYSLSTNREHLFGTVYIDTDNYNSFTLSLLRKLAKAYEKQDIDKIYNLWTVILDNPGGRLNKNYGKIHTTVNMMTNNYNLKADDLKLATETGYIYYNNLYVSPKTLNPNDHDQFNNLIETVTM